MPERPSARGDVGEDGVQFGVIAEQRRELVDDDHQPRKLDARIEDVARAAARQLRLAPPHFGAQALDRAPGAGAVEVGDDARDVRQLGEGVEGGPAFEVGEQEAHFARRARRAQREHPGHEQLALPAPVMPATTACGPSATRSTTAWPPSCEPDDGAEAGEGDIRQQRAESDEAGGCLDARAALPPAPPDRAAIVLGLRKGHAFDRELARRRPPPAAPARRGHVEQRRTRAAEPERTGRRGR